MPKYVSSKEACGLLGVVPLTLRRWEQAGKIKTYRAEGEGTHRYYNVEEYLGRKAGKNEEDIKLETGVRKRYAYCRVSTRAQKDDLERQVEFIRVRYPDHEIVKDIGSGLNFKRKGLQELLKQAIQGNVEELVVAHKDRLARFGFDLIEWVLEEYSTAEIVVLDSSFRSKQEELVTDLLAIITVFSARVNGFRKYRDKITQEFVLPKQKIEEEREGEGEVSGGNEDQGI